MIPREVDNQPEAQQVDYIRKSPPGYATRICLTPRVSGVGGMVSFQHKLATGLEQRGIGVCYDLEDWPYQAVLVIGGTRQLAGLWRARRRGARIVQRLNGMNWLHRLGRNRKGEDGGRVLPGGSIPEVNLRANLTGKGFRLRHYLRSEYGNWILATIRNRIAQHLVYQSEFARNWWERVHNKSATPSTVVYNGVDLDIYSPQGAETRPIGRTRILLVEGSLMGGYEAGMDAAVGLAERLQTDYTRELVGPVEIMVVGRVQPELQNHWNQRTKVHLYWAGLAPRERIPEIDRSAHLLYSADVNAACPNSVIEALACGLPVVAFDTGALPELVSEEAGRITPYGGDPWRLDPPDIDGLSQAAMEVLSDLERFRSGARQRAEQAFSLDRMVDGYLQALLDG
jgi:glycosyltransferase involved in cell wall biosynthesis